VSTVVNWNYYFAPAAHRAALKPFLGLSTGWCDHPSHPSLLQKPNIKRERETPLRRPLTGFEEEKTSPVSCCVLMFYLGLFWIFGLFAIWVLFCGCSLLCNLWSYVRSFLGRLAPFFDIVLVLVTKLDQNLILADIVATSSKFEITFLACKFYLMYACIFACALKIKLKLEIPMIQQGLN
jgi:hypothetical protein